MSPRKNPAASSAVSSNAKTDGQVVMDSQPDDVAPGIGQVAMDALNDVPVINSVPPISQDATAARMVGVPPLSQNAMAAQMVGIPLLGQNAMAAPMGILPLSQNLMASPMGVPSL
eukprot:3648955-Rhodomonas_salina.1